MKNLLSASGFALLAGFALFSTGCVAQYESSASVTSYSSTTLPAAGTVALVMEFRGGEPTPQERADVRALLADYFSQQGTVLVDDTEAADYLVHAVLERRNPENPSEWTVVETYSANSLRSAGSDEFRWPGGLIEDEYYDPTTYSYVGFGLFYPVFFDLWSNPWHRGHVILRPPMRRHDNWNNDRWRDDHRWHRPTRWQGDRRPDGNVRIRPDWNRPGNDRRDRNDNVRPDRDRRDGDRRPDNDRRPDSDRRAGPDRGRVPTADTPRHDSPPVTVQRPPNGGPRPPEQVRRPRNDRPRPVNPPPHVAPPSQPQPQPGPSSPEVRNEHPRRGDNTGPGHRPVAVRPPPVHAQPQPPSNPPPLPQVQPADRRAGSITQFQPSRPEHRRPSTPEVRERVRENRPTPPADSPPQVRTERREPPQRAERSSEVRHQPPRERTVTPAPERREPAPDRNPPPKDNDSDKDKDRPDADRIPRRH